MIFVLWMSVSLIDVVVGDKYYWIISFYQLFSPNNKIDKSTNILQALQNNGLEFYWLKIFHFKILGWTTFFYFKIYC